MWEPRVLEPKKGRLRILELLSWDALEMWHF